MDRSARRNLPTLAIQGWMIKLVAHVKQFNDKHNIPNRSEYMIPSLVLTRADPFIVTTPASNDATIASDEQDGVCRVVDSAPRLVLSSS